MPKIKINPIEIIGASDVKGITKNIHDAVAFMLSTANEINRVIAEINNSSQQEYSPVQKSSVDLSSVEKSIGSIQKEINSNRKESVQKIDIVEQRLNRLIDKTKGYDDTAIKDEIAKMEESLNNLPAAFDDSKVNESITELCTASKLTNDSLQLLKKETESNKKEIDSNRKAHLSRSIKIGKQYKK